MKAPDLVGHRFGYLTVLSPEPSIKWQRRYLVRCDCGVSKIVRSIALVHGKTRSCGHVKHRKPCGRGRKIPIIGLRSGRLIVISEYPQRTKDGQLLWLCRCDCGNETVVRGYSLRQGQTKSCGCIRIERISLPNPEDSAKNRIWEAYTANARKRHLVWELSKSEFFVMLALPCTYCGREPCTVWTSGPSVYVSNGVDRIDSGKGYTQDNSVSCCSECNRAKMEKPADAFIAHCRRVTAFQEGVRATQCSSANDDRMLSDRIN